MTEERNSSEITGCHKNATYQRFSDVTKTGRPSPYAISRLPHFRRKLSTEMHVTVLILALTLILMLSPLITSSQKQRSKSSTPQPEGRPAASQQPASGSSVGSEPSISPAPSASSAEGSTEQPRGGSTEPRATTPQPERTAAPEQTGKRVTLVFLPLRTGYSMHLTIGKLSSLHACKKQMTMFQ